MMLRPDWPALVVAVLAIAAVTVVLVRNRGHRVTWLRRLGIAVAFALVAVRPVVGADTAQAQTSNLDVILVVDRTTSMAAEDYHGNDIRLTGVQHDVRELATQLTGARFVVVTFDNEARVELPPTTDTTAVATVIDAMGYMPSIYGAGSSIGVAVGEVDALLTRMADEDPERQRMLVYFGDGEQTADTDVESFAGLTDQIDAAVVLGYGTTSGGRMRSSPDYDHYVYSPDGGDALSRIDEGNLQQIADDLAGEYLHRTSPDNLTVDSPSQGFSALSGAEVTSGVDLTWIFGSILVGLALWELWHVAGDHRRLRRELR